MNALADDRVGDFVGRHFVAAHKKVGTFRKNGEAKNGGNVATYFCLPDETVIHVIPGPVKADVFLREARWAVDVCESAVLEHADDREKQRDYVKLAHAVRFLKEYRGGLPIPRPDSGASAAARLNAAMPKSLPGGVNALGQGHWLMWSNPLPPLGRVYQTVWTDILNERVTDLPVAVR